MRIVSPQEIEMSFLRIEMSLIRKSMPYFKQITVVFICLLAFLSWTANSVLSSQKFINLNGFNNFIIINKLFILLIPYSLLLLFLNKKLNYSIKIILNLSVWALIYKSVLASTFNSATLSIFVFFIFTYTFGSLGFVINARLRSYYLAFFSIYFWAHYISLLNIPLSISAQIYFSDLKIPFIWIFILYLNKFHHLSKLEKVDMLLNPAHSTRGVLWPLNSRPAENLDEKKFLWLQGSQNIILSFAFIFLKIFVETYLITDELPTLTRTPVVFFLRILTDVALCNLLCGLGRLFGYKVIDASFFAIFAKKPAEYWRRGSVYTFQFVLKLIYLPILNLTRSRILALFLGFLFFYLNRVGFQALTGNIQNFFTTFSFSGLSTNFKINSSIFILYFLSILITQKFWFFNKEQLKKPALAWLSVILTLMVNISIILVVRIWLSGTESL